MSVALHYTNETVAEALEALLESPDIRVRVVKEQTPQSPEIIGYNEDGEAIFRLPGGIICTEEVVSNYFNWSRSPVVPKTTGDGRTILAENPSRYDNEGSFRKFRSKSTHLTPPKKKRK